MFTLAPLPYAYDALEPYLDARTVELHYTKHHQSYVDKLNEAMAKHPEQAKRSLPELLCNLETVPEDIRTKVRNMGGGVYNHDLFWSVLTPKADASPRGSLLTAIEKAFGGVEELRAQALKLGSGHFASGWVWLSLNRTGDLELQTLRDHDCPLSQGKEPLLTLDLWEHAYYLKFQNRRPEFLESAWHVIHWDEVARRFDAARARRHKSA